MENKKLRLKLSKGDFHIEIEGTKEEAEALLEKVLVQMKDVIKASKAKAEDSTLYNLGRYKLPNKRSLTLTDNLRILYVEGFFNAPKSLSDITAELEQKGYNYPTTSLSPIILRFVRRDGILRRIGKKGSYHYLAKKIPDVR